MDKITSLYESLKSRGLLKEIGFEEPIEHVIAVDKIRKYWKPENVRVILLAESHIRTEDKVFQNEKDLTMFEGIDDSYPKNVVDFVYCLGQDVGKIQFWKILFASVGDFDFTKLKIKNVTFKERTMHRIEIIKEMRKRGIWLVDASLLALYPKDKNTSKTRKKIIIECWDNYVKDIIREESPEKILFIGKTISDILEEHIPSNIITDWIYQPQAHLKGGYDNQLKKCHGFCK